MRIVVLLKQVPDTWGARRLDVSTGALDRRSSDPVTDEICERALESALQHKDATGAEVVVMTMGPDQARETLRKGLAMGADTAVHIVDDALAQSDLGWTSAVLAAAITRTGYDLVIAGNESTDGRGGVIPAMIAEHLGVPHLTHLSSVEITADGVRGERDTETGSLTLGAPLPAVISVNERIGEPRFPNFKGIMRAKKKPLETFTVSDLDVALTGARSVVVSTTEQPQRSAGTKVTDDGSAGAQLAAFLTSRGLV